MSQSFASHPARRSPPHIATLIALVGLSTLSMNLFLPSLPAMTDYFQTDYAVMQLSVGGYLAMNALMQLFVGPLSDRYGRRPVILIGVVLFILATVGCILAQTVEIFLLFRMMQCAIVVAMVLSRAVVRDLYPQDQAASMLGWVTMGMSVFPMLGPVLGGFLEEAFNWKANFWALLVAGLLILVITWRDLGETAPMQANSFAEQVRDYPELLTSPRFWGYCITSAAGSGAFFAYLGGAPFVGSEVYGLEPAELGIYFGAPALGYLVGNGISGLYSQRIGTDRMILMGVICQVTVVGLLLGIMLLGYDSLYLFFGFIISVGLGNGLTIPNATAGMLSVRPHLAGTASGLGGAIMIGGGAALSGLAGWLLGFGGGAIPLVALMEASGLIALIAILLTIRRNRRLARSEGSAAP